MPASITWIRRNGSIIVQIGNSVFWHAGNSLRNMVQELASSERRVVEESDIHSTR